MLNFLYSRWKDPLYKNSFYLISSALVAGVFGFLFWIIAARLYTPEDVGVATALISSTGLLILLSRLGFDQAIIRFFPDMDKEKVFSSALYITSLASIFLGIIFIAGISIWAPKLTFIYSIIPLFLILLLIQSLYTLSTTVFAACRKLSLVFIQNILNGTRILFLFPLVFLGAVGIFSSAGISFFLALLIPILLFYRRKLQLKGFDKEFLIKSFKFSIANYISDILLTIPIMITPLIILKFSDPSDVAIYFISYSLISVLLIIPNSFSTSLFIEGSHGESLKKNSVKTFLSIFLLLIPALIFIYFFGNVFLSLFGKEYTQGLELLRLMGISTIFYSILLIYISIKRTQKDIYKLIFINGLNFIIIIGFSYVFLIRFGIIGIGYAWIVGYAILAGVIAILIKTENWSML